MKGQGQNLNMLGAEKLLEIEIQLNGAPKLIGSGTWVSNGHVPDDVSLPIGRGHDPYSTLGCKCTIS